jgi:4-amino-4-deoxy-L-arabinose transferase-like glycosyltransferase
LIWRSQYLAGLCVACLCACAAVDWIYFPATTIFPDEQRYVASALRLAQTGEFWAAGDRAWEMPSTALFYAAIIRAFGAAHLVPVASAAQSLLLVIQALLVGWTAWRVFRNEWAAAVAALITAFYPFFLLYQGLLLSETLFNTLLVASFACLYWWRDRGARLDGAFFTTCLCFAAATMTKATLTVFPVMLLAATAYSCLGWRRAAAVLLAASVAFAALMSPWWIRNYLLFDAFVPFSTSAAKNLYLGNNHNNHTRVSIGEPMPSPTSSRASMPSRMSAPAKVPIQKRRRITSSQSQSHSSSERRANLFASGTWCRTPRPTAALSTRSSAR